MRNEMFHFVAVGAFLVDRTGAAVCAAASPRLVLHHPAGAVRGVVRRTAAPDLLRAWLDLPAGDHREKRPDTGDADLLVIDRLPQTTDTFEIRFGVEAVPGGLPDREDQAFTLVETERRDGESKQVCCLSDRIGWFLHGVAV